MHGEVMPYQSLLGGLVTERETLSPKHNPLFFFVQFFVTSPVDRSITPRTMDKSCFLTAADCRHSWIPTKIRGVYRCWHCEIETDRVQQAHEWYRLAQDLAPNCERAA